MRPHPAHSLASTLLALVLLPGGIAMAASPAPPPPAPEATPAASAPPAASETRWRPTPGDDRRFLDREWERFVKSGTAEREVADALDRQVRQRLAEDLARLGERIDWNDHTWQEMRDMQLRIEQARLLRDRFGLRLRWRNYPLLQMRDFQARIEKAAALERLGVKADWRNYTVEQLEEWAHYQARVQALVHGYPPPGVRPEHDPDEVLEPSFFAVRPVAPEDDPDAVLEPTFIDRFTTGRRLR